MMMMVGEGKHGTSNEITETSLRGKSSSIHEFGLKLQSGVILPKAEEAAILRIIDKNREMQSTEGEDEAKAICKLP